MLAEMLPEEFMEWRAAYLNEPWGDEWEIGGTVAAAAHNIGAPFSGQDPQLPSYFIPKRFETSEERELREERERLAKQRRGGG
jgi:hypothetical protein